MSHLLGGQVKVLGGSASRSVGTWHQGRLATGGSGVRRVCQFWAGGGGGGGGGDGDGDDDDGDCLPRYL